MNKEALRKFLLIANKQGYAQGEEKSWTKESDRSTTIIFEKGHWKYQDNFFGGEPYGGRTVVFVQGKPVWIMVYYGWVLEGVKTKPIYNFLRQALKRGPEDYPWRGPRKYQGGKFLYTNNWQGEIKRFSGAEKISQNGQVVYQAHYCGGLVDQRK